MYANDENILVIPLEIVFDWRLSMRDFLLIILSLNGFETTAGSFNIDRCKRFGYLLPQANDQVLLNLQIKRHSPLIRMSKKELFSFTYTELRIYFAILYFGKNLSDKILAELLHYTISIVSITKISLRKKKYIQYMAISKKK